MAVDANEGSRSAAEASSGLLSAKGRWWTLACWGVLYWLGQPPVQWPVAGWLSCIAFALLLMESSHFTRRDWWCTWLVASAVWLALLHGIRLAFWPLTAGWIALSLYLAVYFPLALWAARMVRDRLRVPPPLACAMGWVTSEVLRAHIITGFAGCLLAHSQTPWPSVLQIASHLGGYGVGFMMMLSMAWLVSFAVNLREKRVLRLRDRWIRDLSASVVLVWLSSSILGMQRRDTYMQGIQPIKPIGRFLLIQDHMPTQFDGGPELLQQGWLRYEATTRRAAKSVDRSSPIDVLVWPESVFGGGAPYMDWDGKPIVPKELEWSVRELESASDNLQSMHEDKVARLSASFPGKPPQLLLGSDVMVIQHGKLYRYNAALWVDHDSSRSVDYYAKQHLVMFGEYIPILSWFPSLLSAVGMGTLSQGDEAKAWALENGRRVAPSICFEDVVPHLIQSQIRELTRAKQAPDVLVNVSNDGWFRGSSALDHHLNSAILTAVENRTPVLVAANTGLSAWIDGDGRIVEKLNRMESGWILAEPVPDGRYGLWSWWGDYPALIVAAISFLPWALGILRWLIRRPTAHPT